MSAAKAALDRATALIDERRFRDALAPSAEACRLEPTWSAAWWNHAVALKHALAREPWDIFAVLDSICDEIASAGPDRLARSRV